MEEFITYEVTFIETKEKWIFQYRKSDKILHCFINLKGSSFINLLRKQTFPENVEMIEQWSKFRKIVTIELKLEDYSFDAFWEKYELKRKKELSQKAFEKLDLVSKIKCFTSLKNYNEDLKKTGQSKAHMVTWINQKRYNDEY
ncbi:hypothetical protein LNQ49_12840 [Flavobacterium sp. F-65]|uniref:Bacteriocin-protection, YdeI or OmpD-Associated n=1 Tax=Flavobacterium pisciphilum TaxID=2893755 RepID=A0ABS8MUN4_9FLAO|nr:hypothetical protein [Flavobacterium sp. F-65]MCC9072470.1 hypothetical protein [Flavobacterium sp. F-65]